VTNQEVRAPEGKLNDLDNKFARRLRKYVSPEATAIPLARPPCPVGLVMLKFTREKYRDQYFVNGTLDCHNRDETKDGM
jgi:hypothetical protein